MTVKPAASFPRRHRAWTWHEAVSPTSLKLVDANIDPLAPGEVLVRNVVIGLNPVDWKVLGGLPGWKTGHIPGVDGAGTVVALGEGVDKSWIGRRVAYHQSLHKPGSFAEHTAVAARALLRVPDGLGLPLAASLPCPMLTALLALDKLPSRPGAKLLIGGAGGAVGNYLTQIAVQRGFAVTAICNSRHWSRLRDLGVQDFVPGPLPTEDRQAADGGDQFFAAIDTVSADHARLLADRLEANGHLVCVQDRLGAWPCEPFGRCISLHEVALGALHSFGTDAAWASLVASGEDIMHKIVSGLVRPESLIIRDFSELPQLLNELRHRHFSGKPLIKIS